MKKLTWLLAGIFLTAGIVLGSAGAVQAADLSFKEQIGSDGYEVYRRTCGELTGDGKISTRDALVALKIAVRNGDYDESAKLAADVNYDGTVSADDVLLLLKAAILGDCTNMGYDKPANDNYIIVDQNAYANGDYCFRSLQEAIDAISKTPATSEAERRTILIAPGTLREHLTIATPYVTLRAMDPSKETKLTFYYANGYNYYSKGKDDKVGSTFVDKGGSNFCAEYITFENSYNLYVTEEELTDLYVTSAIESEVEKHRQDVTEVQKQAWAFYSKADKQVFKNCSFLGRQDTLYIDNGRMYFEDCYIEGTVDFIFGNAAAIFENCHINMPYNTGYLTAASTFGTSDYGFLFHNCTITRNAGVPGKSAPANASYSLGRPWGDKESGDVAMVVFWDCRMDDHIRTGNDRFIDMSIKREEARYYEVGSMDLEGNAMNLSSVCPSYEKILTQNDMTGSGAFAPWRWLYGSDGWNPGQFDMPEESLPTSQN